MACCCWEGAQHLLHGRRPSACALSRRNSNNCDTEQDGARDIVRLPVLLISGRQVASLQLKPTDTATQALRQLREQYGLTGHLQLAWRTSVLHMDEAVAKLGVRDGDHVYLVHAVQPHFDIVTANAEAIVEGGAVRVLEDKRWTWGWAAAFTAPGVRSLSVRLGPTADADANVTDYFIGVLPDNFFKAHSCQNFLADCGVGLVLSSHSRWSGSLKIRGAHHNMPFGDRKFQPGDAVTVEFDAEACTVRFAHGEEWSPAIKAHFDEPVENIRLGVSLYCEMNDGPVRSLEICS